MSLPEVLDTLGGPRVAAVLDTPLVGSNGWLEVGPPDSVPEGGSRLVYYQGQQVAIFNVAGCFYAISNRCSHARGPLCEGTVHNTAGRPVVTCPWHGAQYALDTGRVLSGPAESPVSVFRTKLEGGRLWVSRQAAAFDEVLVANAEHRPER
jgi:nitrite reductase/ring-hydroxylating ferredoxin subunit